MEDNKNKKYDAFLKRLVVEAGLEEPSADFTHTVLNKIETVSKMNTVFVYKPLISKKTWWFLAVMVSGLFVYIVFGNPIVESNLPYLMELKKLLAFNMTGRLTVTTASNTVVYGLLAFTFFMVVQIFWLDRKYAKSLGMG